MADSYLNKSHSESTHIRQLFAYAGEAVSSAGHAGRRVRVERGSVVTEITGCSASRETCLMQ